MSKATEAIDAAMSAHQSSTHERQVANSAGADANAKFTATEKNLKDAVDAVNAEIVQMATDATQLFDPALNPTPKIADVLV